MLVRLISKFLAAALIMAAFSVTSSASAGDKHCVHCQHRQNATTPQCREYQYGNPDLFYNFYVPPTCGGVGAELYPSPLPVPARVGHTYYTYQPLMPHEMLYKHHRSYHRYYNEGRGLTRTSVHWW
jgi:hypothetical protein